MNELMFQAGVKGMSERSELIPCIYYIYTKSRLMMKEVTAYKKYSCKTLYACIYMFVHALCACVYYVIAKKFTFPYLCLYIRRKDVGNPRK